VLGTVWIPAAQSKRRSSAGACVDRSWTQLSGMHGWRIWVESQPS
jgi:hypothetical protein